MSRVHPVDDAEKVAIGVLKDYEVVVRFIALWVTFSAQLKQTLYFTCLVIGIEIEM